MVGVTSNSADAVVKVFSDAARAAHVTVIAGLSRNRSHDGAKRPHRSGATLYTRDGDWFGWAIVMALGALLLGLIPAIAPNSKSAG